MGDDPVLWAGLQFYQKVNESAFSNIVQTQVSTLPKPPLNVVVASNTSDISTGDTLVELTWNTPDNCIVSGYNIYEKYDDSGEWHLIGTTTDLSYIIDYGSGSPDGTYYYKIRAFNSAGESTDSTMESTKVALLPKSPTQCTLVSTDYSDSAKTINLKLSWIDTGTNTIGFNIYQSLDKGVIWTLITSTKDNTCTITYDSNAINGLYSYCVKAYNNSGESSCSNTVQTIVNTFPVPISDLVASAQAKNTVGVYSVVLTWSSANNTSTKIYRSILNENNFSLVSTLPQGSTSYNDILGFSPINGNYYYKVIASNNIGDSKDSNIAIANVVVTPVVPISTNAISTIISFNNIDKNENISDDAISHLIWEFRSQPNIVKFVRTLINPWQEGEDVDFDLLENRWLDTAYGQNLDVIGEIIGESRSINVEAYTDTFVFDGNYLGDGFGDIPVIFGSRTITFTQTVTVTQYELVASTNMAPKEWRLWAAIDSNNSFVLLDAQYNQINWNSHEKRSFQISNTVGYSVYKLEIIDSNNNSQVIIEDFKTVYSYNLNDLASQPQMQLLVGFGEDDQYDLFASNGQENAVGSVGYNCATFSFSFQALITQVDIDSENSTSDKVIEVYGSNDGNNWDQIYVSDTTPCWSGIKSFTFLNAKEYLQYKVYLEWFESNSSEEISEYEISISNAICKDISVVGTQTTDSFNIYGNTSAGGKFAGLFSQNGGGSYSREDEEYRLAIKARIKINTSNGTPEDILDFARFLAGSNAAEFWEMNISCLVGVGLGNYFDPEFYSYIWNGVKKVVPAGVKVLYLTLFNSLQAFIMNSVEDREQGTFIWDDEYWDTEVWWGATITNIDGLGDVNDSSVGGEFAMLI